ncbi:hypothetical protein U1Q18_047798 [Sarracenia purpurea var. burkii]
MVAPASCSIFFSGSILLLPSSLRLNLSLHVFVVPERRSPFSSSLVARFTGDEATETDERGNEEDAGGGGGAGGDWCAPRASRY